MVLRTQDLREDMVDMAMGAVQRHHIVCANSKRRTHISRSIRVPTDQQNAAPRIEKLDQFFDIGLPPRRLNRHQGCLG